MPSHLTPTSCHQAGTPVPGGIRASIALFAVAWAAAIVLLPGCKASDDRPASWEYISPVIFEPTCATGSCHSPASAVAGLDFSTPERGYSSLTGLWVWIVDPKGTLADECMTMRGTVACQRYQRPLVVPFNPSQSRLINVLRAQNAPRMPPNRPLAEADIALVERWILNGAPEGLGSAGATDAGGTARDAASASDAAGDASVDGGDGGGADATLDGGGVGTDAAADGSASDSGAGDGPGVN
jgi:hypothetical protein